MLGDRTGAHGEAAGEQRPDPGHGAENPGSPAGAPAPAAGGASGASPKPTDPAQPETSLKKQGHRFKPGQSGNPAGKPKGARAKVTVLAEKMLADDAKEIVQAIIKAAKAGDATAMKLCLDRILPARRARFAIEGLPEVRTADDVTAATAAILAAVASAQLSPDEARDLAALIEAARKGIELVEFEKRLAALEARTLPKGEPT